VGTVVSNNLSAQLDTSETTLPQLLRSAGPVSYATANVGKWHLHTTIPPVKKTFPNLLGYDFYSGNFSGALSDYFNWVRIRNGVTDTVQLYATTQNINDAIGWLDTLQQGKPFFLWVAFNAPHSPYHKPPDSLHTVPGLTGLPQDIQNNPVKYFKAMVQSMDTEIGRLLQYLGAQSLLDSTNVIFIGDNGTDKAVSQSADTLHIKGTLYEPGIHVPMLISGPVVVNPGRSSNALVNVQDLFATILEMSGVNNWQSQIPVNNLPLDAVSLLPILRDDTTLVRDWIFSEQFGSINPVADGKAIRNSNYKLIELENNTTMFFNISSDSLELTDLLQVGLSAAETLEYNYLCYQLNSLVGQTLCNMQGTGFANGIRSDEGWRLFPVPATIYVELSDCDPVDPPLLRLYDITGQLVRSLAGCVMHTHDLTPGSYILEIALEAGSIYRNVLVAGE
jgi:arylsulfatase A-like enzyme